MKKYLYNYISEIERKLKKGVSQKDVDELLNKISFFSHERLIHLLVTLFFVLFTIIFTIICFIYNNYLLYIVIIILYIMLFCYIIHYFYLENGVQYLYKLYDKMKEKLNY